MAEWFLYDSERTWMAAVMALFEVLFQHLRQGTRKEAMKNLRKDDQCPSQYMNQSLPIYNSEVLSLQLTC